VYRKQVRRRRAVLVALIVVSLVLLSTQFSESQSGPLHGVQRGVATVLSPIEDGASRALKPARDLVNWFDETFHARGENDQLRAEVQRLRAQAVKAQSAEGENAQLHKLVGLDQRSALAGYTPVTARVIGRSPTVWYSSVTVGAGSADGVQTNDPAVTGDGLVGRVSDVTHGTAEVELITDHGSAVSAKVLPDGPQGVVEPEVGDPNTLLLDFIENDQTIQKGATLVTAGWSNGQISSAFPYDIPIGRVTEATAGEQQTYLRVSLKPFADVRNLDVVQVLTGGPERPGVPG
jgi:rod shape-determining protein MreC